MSDYEPGQDLQLVRAPQHLVGSALTKAQQSSSTEAVLLPTTIALASLLGMGIGWFGHTLVQQQTSAPVSDAAPQEVVVRLVLFAPDAEEVHVAGSFNDWQPAASPLEQATDGTWVVRLPLKRGRYEYMFVVDGKTWVPDPTASITIPDEFGRANAILDV